MITISHAEWTAAINPLGAELQSLCYQQEELMWGRDPKIWAGCAPILFPVVGKLHQGQYTYSNRTYSMPKHGVVRRAPWHIAEQTEHSVTLQFLADTETLAQYPWNFHLSVTFYLGDDGLKVRYKVSNCDDSPMYFSLGSHPAFALPDSPNGLRDYHIHFNKPETLDRFVISESGLSAHGTPFLQQEQMIPLSEDRFNDDALVFKNIASDQISIINNLTGRQLTLHTQGAPDLGLWSPPGAPFICIEPWFGYDDPEDHDGKLKHKPGIRLLEPATDFVTGYSVSFKPGS